MANPYGLTDAQMKTLGKQISAGINMVDAINSLTGLHLTQQSIEAGLTQGFDTQTMDFIKQNFGSEAAWYFDPEIGPVLRAALRAGEGGTRLQGQAYQDYIKTHYVDAKGSIQYDPSMTKTWWGQKGASVRLALATQKNDPATYAQNVTNILKSDIMPIANSLGVTDPNILKKVAETAYVNGWTSQAQIREALIGEMDFTQTNSADPSKVGPSGDATTVQDDYEKIASEYGIPMPTDPVQRANFIKAAIGPGGNEQSFIDYAKGIAKAQFPWMAASIDGGVTPKAYLTPYTTVIANTMGLSPDAVNWSDPKWLSLMQNQDQSGTRVTTMPTMNQIVTKLKTDPTYKYDDTQPAKAEGFDLANFVGQMFGRVAK